MAELGHIQFFVGKEPRYLNESTGEVISEEQMNEVRKKHYRGDFNAGYHDAKGGHYDEWYEKHRSDKGLAYKEGVEKAKSEGAVIEVLIPCN